MDMVVKTGKLQKNKQRWQDLFWMVHNSVFVLFFFLSRNEATVVLSALSRPTTNKNI